MKVFNIVCALLFLTAAILQYNDPDPYIWVSVYLYTAILCWLALRGKHYPGLYLAGIIIFALYAIYLFFAQDGVANWIEEHNSENIAQSMKAQKPWIEATREFFGLILMLAALLINYLNSRKSFRRNKQVKNFGK